MPTKTLTVRQFFGKRGLLSEWHPNYEFRDGQLEMAEAVESALADKRHLIVEAGTGTGKTLAYLVPAILSGKRVVISTGTKNLQEQLFFKDIPFLEKNLGPLRACYMKGRANYACRQKIYDAEKEPVLEGLEEVADFQIIRDWEKSTETGDRAEIKTLPESSSAWAKIDARSDLCTGEKCPQFERCFITRMHQKALESDIIIVNHHLFFADLAVKDGEMGGIIPDYGAVIFDEAHEIEDVAGQYFGVTVSSYQFEELTRDVAALAHRKEMKAVELERILISAADRASAFLGLFGATDGRTGFRSHEAFLIQHEDLYRDVLAGLELIALQLELLKAPPEESIPLISRAREIARRLEFFMQGDDRRYVYWIERRGRGTFLQATPIDVSSAARRKIIRSRRHHRAHFRYARRRRRIRIYQGTPRPAQCPHADRRQPFRLRETGAVLCSAIAARSAQPGIHRRRRAGDYRDSRMQPRPGLRAVHQLSADAPDLRSRVVRDSL